MHALMCLTDVLRQPLSVSLDSAVMSSLFSCSQTEEVSVETEEEAGSQETRWMTAGPEADRKELFHVCRSFGVDCEQLHEAYCRLFFFNV